MYRTRVIHSLFIRDKYRTNRVGYRSEQKQQKIMARIKHHVWFLSYCQRRSSWCRLAPLPFRPPRCAPLRTAVTNPDTVAAAELLHATNPHQYSLPPQLSCVFGTVAHKEDATKMTRLWKKIERQCTGRAIVPQRQGASARTHNLASSAPDAEIGR